MKKQFALALAAACLALAAHGADDRFHKLAPDSNNGLLAATDPTYVNECGTCHFPYSPGLLPARSWELHLSRLDKHFGESIVLAPALAATLRRYLVDNAADRSPYAGSQVIMQRIEASATPYRFLDVPLFREMHTIMLEVIATKPKVKVRRLTNCNECHQYAPEGSYGTTELFIPGLTPSRRRR